MIRNLLATTAIATLVATGAVAQQSTTPADPAAPAGTQGTQQEQMTIRAEGHLASNLIGESVYNGTGEDAENIGEVTDLVISQDGNVQAIVVGVGGFLGIGQKEVSLEYDVVQWSEQQDGERWLVVETSRDALEAQQEFDRSAYRPMPADADVAETQPATADDLAATPAPQDGAEGGTTDQTAMAPTGDEADTQTSGDQGNMAAAPTDEQSADATGDDMAAAPTDEQSADATGDDMAAAPTDEQSADATGDDVAVAPIEEEGVTDEQDGGATQDMAATDQREDRIGDDQTAQTDQQQGQAAQTDQTTTAAVSPDNMQQAQPDQIRAENLTGTGVYGANEERVGEIGDVILTPEGEVDAVIVDVGGFLGIGEKEVAIGIDNLAFMTDENGEMYLFTEFTQEDLEAQPEYDEATYAEQRNNMRMQVQ